MLRILLCALLSLFCSALLTPRAHAGGFDTPILYSARHMGMGGTAIGYVNDPSAMYHNPAGLSGVRGLSVLGDLSLLNGKITSSPGGFYDPDRTLNGLYTSRTSKLITAPAFLAGIGYHLNKWVSFGSALFPVASASGEYQTTGTDFITGKPRQSINRTKLTFIEATTGASLSLPFGLSLGLGYRITLAELERVQGWKDDPTYFDFKVKGVDLKGFRAGLQWRINPHWSAGLVYRTRIEPKLTAKHGTAVDRSFTGLETTFVLPAKLGSGVRMDYGNIGAAVDLEYGFYSQNKRTVLNAKGLATPVENVFHWRNAATLRLGAEYRLFGKVPLRAGYVYDGQVSTKHYPSAFGTPPTASHSGTLGAGYRGERFQVNVAAALRLASTSVSAHDTDDDSNNGLPDRYPCATCSKAGSDYSLWLTGAYVDFSYDFDI